MVLHSLRLMASNLFVRVCGFWNPGNFGLWNSESGKKMLDCEIRNTAQGICIPT